MSEIINKINVKTRLKISQLEVEKVYERVENPFPNHILNFIDESGILWDKDILLNCEHKNQMEYNKVIKLRFVEVK